MIDFRREYSEDEIEQAFAEAFQTPATYNDISTWEGLVEWENGDDMTVVLEITSMAGNPTKEEFEDIDEFQSLELDMFDGKKVVLEIREVLHLNGTDYRVIYVPSEGAELSEEDEAIYDDASAPEADESTEDAQDFIGTGNTGWGEIEKE